ncbi:ATP-binding protein [Kitasatospora viridis]|uniref:Regulatory LuxR family protein n=1 Tax=Kitasatospora viridis TaxID=281105 RepID=A0A561SE67_9ACTN|nr:LuxR family transcriptional regulator [Kitasatospora viridis]TWF73151.1 regulatory LuxR family protein [Kitasatospora viridis]
MLISSPVVVGRGDELALLDDSLAAARQGEGRAVFLLGEAGIGKSRLAAECAYRAFSGGQAVLRGRAATSGVTMPFRPIAEALLSHFRLGGPPQLPELAPYRSALGSLLPEWRAAEPAGEAPSLFETAEAVLRLLLAISRDLTQHRGPGCLLVIEDLHDAEAETLAVVEYLCDNLRGLPVCLLVTLRPHAHQAGELARTAALRRTAVLTELRPLTGDEVRTMAAAALAVDDGQLPAAVADRLVRDGEGNPFVVEELLGGMVSAGVLRRGPVGDWQVDGDLGIDVPTTVVHSVAQRAAGLSPAGRAMLDTAAVLGRRFSLPVLKLVTGLEDRDLLVHLRAGIDAQLISPSGPVGDWYEFRHALTAEALLAQLLPAERAAIASQAADAVERAHPGLPGEWCPQVAALRLTAGDTRAAALHFAEAGRAALAGGAVNSAVSLLEQAHGLLTGPAEAADRSRVAEQLAYTLIETGQLDRATGLVETLPAAGAGVLGTGRDLALHTRLAWAAVTAGRYEEAAARVQYVRSRLGGFISATHTPAVDVVEAYLVFAGVEGPDTDRAAEAERLARRAAAGAERVGLAEVACQAWDLLALFERRYGFDRADACLERGLALATEHGLTGWQVTLLIRLGANEFLRSGSCDRLQRAHRAALSHGALVLMHSAEATLAIQAVLRGEYATARELTDGCVEATARLRNADNHQLVLLTRAALAAHQGRRREMDRELAEFRRWDGERSLQLPLVFGSRAVCALLEEDRAQALDELDRALAWEDRNPSVFYLSGRYGLRPLLRALTGQADAAEHEQAAAHPAAMLPWNRQFERLAHAVHEGRAGRTAAARAAVAEAGRVGAPFLMARRLGLRLVAEAALADGWGEPVEWLRGAEEYFHAGAVPAVAVACRELLRRAGAGVPQRRTGTEAVPAELRRRGLTAREYDVFLLLLHRLGNQEIAQRLFISPRTVEKHVASLLAKTGCPHRAALCDHAAEVLRRPDPAPGVSARP